MRLIARTKPGTTKADQTWLFTRMNTTVKFLMHTYLKSYITLSQNMHLCMVIKTKWMYIFGDAETWMLHEQKNISSINYCTSQNVFMHRIFENIKYKRASALAENL